MTTKGSGLSTSSSKTVVTIADKYVVEKEIGKGSFAVVYKGHLLTNNEENVAIKAVSRSKLKNKKLLENLEIEIAILKKIKHSHIVDLLECERAVTDFYLIMEYCALGDLTFFIKKRKSLVEKHPLIRTVFEKYPPPSEQHNGLNRVLVINYLQQLSSALRFLRSKNLVHRDIKPQNLLLSTPLLDYSDAKTFHDRGFVGIYNLPILKIADFGFARFLPNTSLAETLCGSPLYMAPEILNYQKYNAKADLWSVGTVLYEMCCGKPPFKASNHLELFQKIKKANDTINFPKHVELEPQMVDLICRLLTFEPTKRMDFTEFFSNELVNENLTQYEEDSEPDLESRSRDVAESNMFVLEYLTANDRMKRSPSVHLPNLAVSVDPVRPVQQPPAGVKQISNKEIRPLYADKHAVSAPSNIETRSTKISEKLKSSYSDLLLEKEYVVVEKKSVEVNALADEFAHAGSGLQAIRLPDQQLHDLPQPTYPNQHSLSSAGLLSGNPKQTFMRRNSRNLSSSGGSTSRRPSLVDRRMSITSLGAANALSKALGMASQRLFGSTQQQSSNNVAALKQNPSTSPVQTAQAFHEMTENLVLGADHQWDNSKQADIVHDDVIIRALENLTAKSFVIYSFAEVKFSQIIPLPSTSPHEHFPNKRLSNGSCAIDDEDEEIDPTAPVEAPKKGIANGNFNNGNIFHFSLDTIHELSLNDLPPRELHHLCTESIVLYMKSLSLLAYAMQLTSKWWHESSDKTCPLKLNLLVQWIREKFNECLEKAEFLRSKLQSLKMNFSDQQLSLSETEDREPVFVEKLIYDRALDISKGAAKMEIQGEYLESCEVAYSTSLWMLESLLDVINDDDNYDDDNLGHTSVLDSADREMVKKYIDSIANRLKALRKKIGR